MLSYDIKEIMSLIPHRYPLLLVDKVIECDIENLKISGVKNVSINEQFFMGHFPSNPVMPGVLIVEALAQLSCILSAAKQSSVKDKEVFFMSITDTKFRKPVVPGDVLNLYSEIVQVRGNVSKFVACAKVDDVIVTESNFTAMIRNKE